MTIDKTLISVYKEVSEELGIPKEVVDRAYRDFWNFTKEVFESIPIQSIKTEEDFNKIRASMNIPKFGKLYTSWEKILGARNKWEYLKKLRDEENTDKY